MGHGYEVRSVIMLIIFGLWLCGSLIDCHKAWMAVCLPCNCGIVLSILGSNQAVGTSMCSIKASMVHKQCYMSLPCMNLRAWSILNNAQPENRCDLVAKSGSSAVCRGGISQQL